MDTGGKTEPGRIPQYVGNIYPFSGDVVRGWLADKRNLDHPVAFRLLVDDTPRGEFLANRSRKHLRDQKIGTGEYGFDIPVDPSWDIRPGAVLAVRPLGAQFFELIHRVEGQAPEPATSSARPLDRKTVVEFLNATDDETLISVLQETFRTAVLPRARGHFASKAWAPLSAFHRILVEPSEDRERLLMVVGRGAIYTRDFASAQRLLKVGTILFPGSEEMQYYCGVAAARADQYVEAVGFFRAALKLAPGAARTKKELANALRRVARDADTPQERAALLGDAAELLQDVLDQEFNRSSALALGRLLYDLGRNEQALAVADRLITPGSEEIDALLLKSRCLVALNRVGEALAIAEEVARIDPLNQTAQFQLRALRYLGDGKEPDRPATFGDLILLASGGLAIGPLGAAAQAEPLVPAAAEDLALTRVPFDWLRLGGGKAGDDLSGAVDAFSGFCEAIPGVKLWRREVLIHLAESGLIGPDLSGLAGLERFYRRARVTDDPSPRAIVLSRHGSFKFGGGEQFIESMAEHYRSVGYDPIILGTRPEFVGSSGEANGFSFAFVDEKPAALRRFFLESGATLVHAISGLGFGVTEALSYTNIPFIYGVHFWREALGNDSDEGYFDEAGEPVPRAEFRYILSRAASVYANSQFTRAVLEKAYGVRCPVIYSVPREVETAP